MSSVPKERRGLGRGLEVLLGDGGQPELLHLPVESVHPSPRQPRRRFEPEAAAGLAASVRLQGVLQPIVVRRRTEGGFELIAGERRWRAARAAGIPTLPALVRDVDDGDSLLLGLVENVAREQLSAVEEARAYASLVDEFELSLSDVAERVGRSKPAVSNRLRLLELPEEVLWMLARGDLTEGHARAVLSLPDDDARRRAFVVAAAHVAGDGADVLGDVDLHHRLLLTQGHAFIPVSAYIRQYLNNRLPILWNATKEGLFRLLLAGSGRSTTPSIRAAFFQKLSR